MSDDDKDSRTERASEKHLTEAREKGDVARSRDFSAAVVTLAGVAVLLSMRHSIGQHLADLADLRLPAVAAGATHVYHLYVVHHPGRDALQQHLTAQGIGTLIHYPVPPHRQQAYADLRLPAGAFPIAEELAATALSLPMWPGMTEPHVAAVAAAIRSY